MKKVWIVLILFFGGLSGGFYLDHYVERLLFEVLEDELKASTPCSLKTDTWEVSLLTLSASAKNPRVICPDGSVPLRLDRIKGSFSLRKIWDKRIVIDPLILEGGYAEGLMPGDPSYDFIYYLSAPLPPGKASTGIKARLERLKLQGTKFTHNFNPDLQFDAKDSSLEFRRNDKDEVTLIPALKNISFRDLKLDEIKAVIKSDESDEVKVEDLLVRGPSASLIGNILSKEDLSGYISGTVSALTPLSGELRTETTINSKQETINVSSTLNSEDLALDGLSLSPFYTELQGEIADRVQIESNLINLGQLVVKNFSLELSPKLQGSAILELNALELDGATLKGGSLSLNINEDSLELKGILKNIESPLETIENIEIDGSGSLSDFEVKGSSSKLNFYANLKPEDLNARFEIKGLNKVNGIGEYIKGDLKFSGTYNDNITITAKSKNNVNFIGPGVKAAIERENDLFKVSAEIDRYEYKPCLLISGNILYEFKDPKLGNGALKNLSVTPDCDAEPFKIEKPINIRDGKIKFDNFQFLSNEIKGVISLADGYDLLVTGSTPLDYFAGFAPGIDELSGTTALTLKVTGKIDTPEVNGTFKIEDGVVEKESLNLAVSRLKGIAEIQGHVIYPRDITAEINGGPARIEGIINLSDLSTSVGTLTFREISLEPENDISITASGSLTITSNPLLISGVVTVNSGEIQRYVNLRSLISETIRGIFERDIAMTKENGSNVPVSVIVQVPQSLFVQTNFFEAELSGDLKLGGTLNNLDIVGTILTENGWLGLRGRRFDITDGRIVFRGAGSEPTVRILSESMFLPSEQDAVSVFLEVDGPLSSPKINLASDRNLTDQQLLNIITGGTSESELTVVNTQYQTGTSNEEFSLFDAIPFLPFPSFLRDLTKIDTLAIDPRYDPFSGQYEPVVSARKRLTDVLELVGESSFQGTRSSSGAKLVYNLNPRVNIIGLLRSLQFEQQTIVGVDVTWTILARKTPRIDFTIEGNRNLSYTEVLSAMSITPFSIVSDLDSLKDRLITKYRDLGFPNPTIDLTCSSWEKTECRDLNIKIYEGQDRRLISVTSDPIPVELPSVTDDRASTEKALEIAKIVTNRLRNEGYVSARVSPVYNCESFSCTLHLSVNLGTPLTFIFEGNRAFSANDFLKSIRLFTRKQPFGVNTPKILEENIIAMYESAGFPFVTVTRRKESKDNRLVYIFEINEGSIPHISSVNVEGIDNLDQLVETKDIFSIRDAKKENIERAKSLILLALRRAGYSEPSVEFKIDNNQLIFSARGHKNSLPNKLDIIGADDLPPLPDLPLSETVLKGYQATALEYLKDKGFREAKIELEGNVLNVEKGVLYKLEDIDVSGNSKVSNQVIKEALEEFFGKPLSEKRGYEIQTTLLKLGLFQKVTVGLDKNIAKIQVEERPLTTLEVGGGYSSSLGVHIFGESTDRSLFADGKSLTLRLDGYMNSLDGSFSQGIASVRFLEPTVFDSNWSFATETSFQRQELATYEFDLNRSILGGSLFRSWDSGLNLSGGYRILEENLKNVALDAQLSELDSGNVFLGMLSGGMVLDKRDYALNPSSGYILGFDSTFASEAIGSDANYTGFNLRGTHYLPISSRWTWLTGFQAGKRWTFSGTDFVPISQRYYLGGRGTVRGYNENSLGPRGEDESVIGGEELIRGNFELQYRLYEDLAVLGFYDIGRLRLPGLESEYDDFQAGVGLGFRYISPIGPIGLDFGHGLDDVPGSRKMRVTFEIGVAF